jgi:hypothetical protein
MMDNLYKLVVDFPASGKRELKGYLKYIKKDNRFRIDIVENEYKTGFHLDVKPEWIITAIPLKGCKSMDYRRREEKEFRKYPAGMKNRSLIYRIIMGYPNPSKYINELKIRGFTDAEIEQFIEIGSELRTKGEIKKGIIITPK